MSGTPEGWARAKATMIERMGGVAAFKQSRAEIGRKGGKVSRGGGFTGNPELAQAVGNLGGAAAHWRDK